MVIVVKVLDRKQMLTLLDHFHPLFAVLLFCCFAFCCFAVLMFCCFAVLPFCCLLSVVCCLLFVYKDTCEAGEDPCKKIDSETSILGAAQEKCEQNGNCEFSYSVMAGGKKCAAAPSDPNVKVLSNPQDNAKMCYTRLNVEPCTCHKAQCSKVLTEKWVELGIILQSENRGEEEADSLLDYFQFSLDIMGMIPGFGMVADAINTGIYGYREMWSDAVYSALAVVPAFGDMLGSVKVSFKALGFGFGGIDFFNNILGYVDTALEILNTGKNALIDFFKHTLTPLVKSTMDDGLSGAMPALLEGKSSLVINCCKMLYLSL
jgi:hypothetical protein